MTFHQKKFRKMKKQIGQQIYVERSKYNLTLKQLGRRANLNPDTLDQYEMGKGKFNLDVLFRIANALNVPLQAFLRPG